MTPLNSDKIKELEAEIVKLKLELSVAHSQTQYERHRATELQKELRELDIKLAKFKARILSVDSNQFSESYTMSFNPSLYYRMPADERKEFLTYAMRDMLRQILHDATCIEELYAKQPRH